jgi:DNA-binding NarL/FixJ family response regulator
MSPRILLVDEHPNVRQALRGLLAWEGLDVVGEARYGAEALRLVWELCADVIVLNITRPISLCLDAAREIVRTAPLKGMILVAFEDYLVDRAFQAGVRGYVLTTRVVEELPLAIRAVARGEIYVSPDIPPAIGEGCLTAIAHLPAGT